MAEHIQMEFFVHPKLYRDYISASIYNDRFRAHRAGTYLHDGGWKFAISP